VSAEELLTRQTAVVGLFLIVNGLAVIVLRRRFIAFVLGVQLTILGAAVLMCRPGAPVDGWTASILIAASLLFTPMTLAAFAWWRRVSGKTETTSLISLNGRIDG
jgi:hypothetical protein